MDPPRRSGTLRVRYKLNQMDPYSVRSQIGGSLIMKRLEKHVERLTSQCTSVYMSTRLSPSTWLTSGSSRWGTSSTMRLHTDPAQPPHWLSIKTCSWEHINAEASVGYGKVKQLPCLDSLILKLAAAVHLFPSVTHVVVK